MRRERAGMRSSVRFQQGTPAATSCAQNARPRCKGTSMSRITTTLVVTTLLTLAAGPAASAAASPASAARLVVLGTAADAAGCSVAHAAAGSFSLPHAIECSAAGTAAVFNGIGAAATSVHAFRTGTPQFAAATGASGARLLEFGAAGTRLAVAVPALTPGEFVAAVLEWQQADSQLELCVAAAAGAGANCTAAAGGGTRVLLIGNPATSAENSAAQTLEFEVAWATGNAPGELRLAVEDSGVRATIEGAVDRSGMRAQDKQDQPQVDVNLDLNPTTINVGQSATLTWTTTNADSCTASGGTSDWPSDNKPLNGQQVVTPPSANSYSYTLSCVNSDSQSMETQVLTVLTPSSGGGALDWTVLTLLAGLGLKRARRPRQSRRAS
jgi:hypothetical protein